MRQTYRNWLFKGFLGGFAISVSITSFPVTVWAADPINSYNDGRIIQGGTYLNTADGKTTFANSAGTGLWLKSGSNLRGMEVDTTGVQTNNGGTFHFYAPNSVVRLDGNVDVNALRNQSGAYLGNGGKVFVDSAYLFQNGNIYANGQNGGLMQVNVGGMTLGNNAHIEAQGSTDAGGVVAVNSSGPVDIRKGAVITTSGQVGYGFDFLSGATYDRNLINIEGSVVNNDGTLRADGSIAGGQGGTIRLVATGQSDLRTLKNDLQTATTGSNPVLTAQERTFLLQRNNGFIQNHDGDVILAKGSSNASPSYNSVVSANGTPGNDDDFNDMTQNILTRAGDGGTIIISAMRHVVNQGTIFANGARGTTTGNHLNGGGDGGTIVLTAQGDIQNDHGRLEANGGAGANGDVFARAGGNGGVLAFSYNAAMSNTGGMYADGGLGGSANTPSHGGNGGLVMLSGNTNPTGNGSVDVLGRSGGNNNFSLGGSSGYIISPNPGTLGNGQVYFQQGYQSGQLVSNRATLQTQPVELLTHHENLILFTKNSGTRPVSVNLFDRMLQATYRSLQDPTGGSGQTRLEIIGKNSEENKDKNNADYVYRNLVLASSRDGLSLSLQHPLNAESFPGGVDYSLLFPSPLSNGRAFSTLNTLTLANDGSVSTQRVPGPYADDGDQLTDFWLIGHNLNNYGVGRNFGGGRISVLANGDLTNQDFFGTVGVASGGSVNIALSGNLFNGAGGQGRIITSSPAVPDAYPMHGGSIIVKTGQNIMQNTGNFYNGATFQSNGKLSGGTVQLTSKQDFVYGDSLNLATLNANGGLQGGVFQITADGNIRKDFGIIGGNVGIFANGTSAQGRGGFIQLDGHTVNLPVDNGAPMQIPIQANGPAGNGTVLVTTH